MASHHSPLHEEFYRGILTLKTEAECRAFFEDVCTIKELEALAQRFQVAQLLSDGKNYNEINDQTGVSTATICRVNKCLNYGDGGYRTVLERMKRSGNDA